MNSHVDEAKEASECRDLALRSRRMASGLTLATDRALVNEYADELERRASELEAQQQQQAAPA